MKTDELRDLIIRAMAKHGAGEGDNPQTAGQVADRLIDFTNFLEGIYIDGVISAAVVLSSAEKTGEIKAGATRGFLEACLADVDINLRRAIGRARNGLLVIDPYAEKTHNEKVAELSRFLRPSNAKAMENLTDHVHRLRMPLPPKL